MIARILHRVVTRLVEIEVGRDPLDGEPHLRSDERITERLTSGRLESQRLLEPMLVDLPPNARAYVKRVEALVGVKVIGVSVGADRGQTILRENPFHA